VTGTIYDGLLRHYSTSDPAEPGRIEADGSFRLRFKPESGPDFTLVGQLERYSGVASLRDYAGRGRVVGGKYHGQTFFFGAHDPY
jgi:hypothetical protein